MSRASPSPEAVQAVAEQQKVGARYHPPGTRVNVQERDKPPIIVPAEVVSYHTRGIAPFYTLRLADGTEIRRCAQRVRKARKNVRTSDRTAAG